ncbi:MAG: aspartate carbamoyltransferase [Candidatus Micrarchaeia archaeon]
MEDLVSIRDVDRKYVEGIFSRADAMASAIGKGREPAKGKVVATLFFEPSTRTRLSFQTAALRLGARVINFEAGAATSMAKGETLSDTIRIVDGYSDVLVMRHALEGSVRFAAEIAEHPVVNAGDGGNQHPTQTILDLYTIRRLKGKIAGLSVHLVGDLKHARVMRSLLYGLAMFGADVTLVAPAGLEMDPSTVREVEEKFGVRPRASNALDVRDADVLYACRIQKERFTDPYEAEKLQKEFRITEAALRGCKPDLVILHPLPKIDEMDPAIDRTPYAKYFEQARLGVPVRMAILAGLLGV